MTSARWSRQNTRASVRRSVLETVSSQSGLNGLNAFPTSVVRNQRPRPSKVSFVLYTYRRLVFVQRTLQLCIALIVLGKYYKQKDATSRLQLNLPIQFN